MLFNSFEFLLFFAAVYALYWFLPHKLQNRMLLLASYVFYGWWDARFLGLLLISTTVDYYCGLKIESLQEEKARKRFVVLSVATNLGILGFFKYFNFFAENFAVLAGVFGWKPDPITLNIILPLGISFYTFQTMSYSIDVYRRQVKPTRNYLDFALYVAFFPQLIAGPIERAGRLLPQILSPRKWVSEHFFDGIWLFAWGLYKKVFIADNLGRVVDEIFLKSGSFSGFEALVGVYAFSFQIYCDFSGYSDMARGLGKLLGIDIMVNFRRPLLAPNPTNLWERWHISLTSWVRDYVLYPLSGIRIRGKRMDRSLTILITFGLIGLWHGASWRFVLWGLFWGVALVIHRALLPYLSKFNPRNFFAAGLWYFLRVLFMFQLGAVALILFRAGSMTQAWNYMVQIATNFAYTDWGQFYLNQTVFFGLPLLLIEFCQKDDEARPGIFAWPSFLRWATYLLVFLSLTLWGDTDVQPFIYFQF